MPHLGIRPRGSAPCDFPLPSWTPGSHVPRESPNRDHAASMPVTTESVNRSRLGWIPGQRLEPGFGDVPTLSTPPRRFTCVRLLGPYLTGSRPAFSGTLTTRAFGLSSFRWFGTWSCNPIPRDLPSSLTRHGVPNRTPSPILHAFVAHSHRRTLRRQNSPVLLGVWPFSPGWRRPYIFPCTYFDNVTLNI